jgi:hypothetical protein
MNDYLRNINSKLHIQNSICTPVVFDAEELRSDTIGR